MGHLCWEKRRRSGLPGPRELDGLFLTVLLVLVRFGREGYGVALELHPGLDGLARLVPLPLGGDLDDGAGNRVRELLLDARELLLLFRVGRVGGDHAGAVAPELNVPDLLRVVFELLPLADDLLGVRTTPGRGEREGEGHEREPTRSQQHVDAPRGCRPPDG